MSKVFDLGNAELNQFVKENLRLEGNHRALEIGFGTGGLISELAGQLDDGSIEGVDFSGTMVNIATRKNRRYIRTGKVMLRVGDFDSLPFGDLRYDRIFTVNTIYFWKNPEATVRKISDLLKKNGQLAIGFQAGDEMEKMSLDRKVFRYFSPSDLEELLAGHGRFQNVRVHSRPGTGKTICCAMATK